MFWGPHWRIFDAIGSHCLHQPRANIVLCFGKHLTPQQGCFLHSPCFALCAWSEEFSHKQNGELQSTDLLICQAKKLFLSTNSGRESGKYWGVEPANLGLLNLKQQKFRCFNQLDLRSWTNKIKVVKKNSFTLLFNAKMWFQPATYLTMHKELKHAKTSQS